MTENDDIIVPTTLLGLAAEEASDHLRSFLVSPGTLAFNKEGMESVAKALALLEGISGEPQNEQDGICPSRKFAN